MEPYPEPSLEQWEELLKTIPPGWSVEQWVRARKVALGDYKVEIPGEFVEDPDGNPLGVGESRHLTSGWQPATDNEEDVE